MPLGKLHGQWTVIWWITMLTWTIDNVAFALPADRGAMLQYACVCILLWFKKMHTYITTGQCVLCPYRVGIYWFIDLLNTMNRWLQYKFGLGIFHVVPTKAQCVPVIYEWWAPRICLVDHVDYDYWVLFTGFYLFISRPNGDITRYTHRGPMRSNLIERMVHQYVNHIE